MGKDDIKESKGGAAEGDREFLANDEQIVLNNKIEKLQRLAISEIDRIEKEYKKYMHMRRKAFEDTNKHLNSNMKWDDRGDVKYGHTDERKVAILSYIANFPDYVNEDKIKELAENFLRKFEKSEDENADGYVNFGVKVINVLNKGKTRVIEDISEHTYIHEMIHTTSWRQNNLEKLMCVSSFVERGIYNFLEEGITEAKTQKIVRSVEYRELCKQYNIMSLHKNMYLQEQVIAIALNILSDGELFKAHCDSMESFDKVLSSLYDKTPGLKEVLCSYSGGWKQPISKTKSYAQVSSIVLPRLLEKKVTKDNVLWFYYLRSRVIESMDYICCLKTEDDKNLYYENIDKFAHHIYGKIGEFNFDRTKLDSAINESGIKYGVDYEGQRKFLDWLDSTGLAKTDLYSQYISEIRNNSLLRRSNIYMYYDEAAYGLPKGSKSEGDIWEKARKVAFLRGDVVAENDIKCFLNNNPRIKETITPERYYLYDGNYDCMTGEYLPPQRLKAILQDNNQNEIFKQMSREDKMRYIEDMNPEDTAMLAYMREHFDKVNEELIDNSIEKSDDFRQETLGKLLEGEEVDLNILDKNCS